MVSVTPFLWFPHGIAEPLALYTATFPNALVDGAPWSATDAAGSIPNFARLTVGELTFILFDGGDGVDFRFNESQSLFISCDTAEEVDHYWNALVEGGEPGRCGWLKDRFGVSWQVVPTLLGTLMGDPDPERSRRVFEAMMGMSKLECSALQAAYDGE